MRKYNIFFIIQLNRMIWNIILLCGIIVTVANATWLSPYFEAGPRADVNFKMSSGIAVISMNEEINAPITIAIITGYTGAEKPNLRFTTGNNFDLGLEFQLKTVADVNQWHLVVNNKQDYEQPNMQKYIFTILIDTETKTVQLTINNIFDNKPIVSLDFTSCSIPELTDIHYDSKCTFNVYDADGMPDNRITFNIIGLYNESRLFEFVETTKIDNYNVKYTLIVQEPLYYHLRALYNFRTMVSDIGNNEGSFITIIEVQDMPNREPMWIRAFASARFPEKTPKQFEVVAIDGDTGIDTEICYKIKFEIDRDYSEIITIGEKTGKINVNAIDRDARKNEFYPFDIVAYKCNNESSFINGSAALIVDDINDNLPEIYLTSSDTKIQIKEQQFATIFNSSTLFIEDIDLGTNAEYKVILSQVKDADRSYSNAFNVIPLNGYQKQTFTISVADTDLIDYEDINWQQFTIMIIATESLNTKHQTEQSFQVELLNWNDELPKFKEEEYLFEVNETITMNSLIGQVTATDRDIDDRIIYSLVGLIGDTFSIDSDNGKLFTIVDDTFDYERQTEVFMQVQARDTLQTFNEPPHYTYTQIRIQVNDVNDETPELKMPREILMILENVRDATVTNKIEATDPDTTAHLVYTIDWEKSYASKPGFRPVDAEFYEGCFIIESEEDSRNKVFGILKANPAFKYNIDYEKYEIIYLSIIVTDLNQEVNQDSATAILTVRILDENDNPPEFIGDTLSLPRNVIEEAQAGTLIGTIFARDIDGPENNIIQYFMSPINDTPDELLAINKETGVISVLERKIDCDVPKRFHLDYRIKLSDSANETVGDIQIRITDTNNKIPQVGDFAMEISLYENATTGDEITRVLVTDLDRDTPHNLVQYRINYLNYRNLQKYFVIDELLGELNVKLEGENVLDRDNGEAEHFIYINFEDNFQGNGVRNGDQLVVHLILKDVNDNAPVMPTKFEYQIVENVNENHIVDDQFYAPDNDDLKTPNAMVSYELLSIEPENVNLPLPSNYQDMFRMESYGGLYGRIKTTKSLKGYSGKWRLTIKAYDHGDDWDSRISLSSTATYFVSIEPFNFNSPKIIYPLADATIRLDFDAIGIGKNLLTIEGNELRLFEAVDDDAGIYGDITFRLTSNNDDSLSFEMVKLNRKQSQLKTTRIIQERSYTFNIMAVDGGERSDRATNIRISFVNKTGEPYFPPPNIWTTNFTENVEGQNESRLILEAYDPKNAEVINEADKYKIFYFIDENYRPDDAKFFQLDKLTRMLSLKQDLDRETVDRHQIKIIATNLESFPSKTVSENSMLLVDITVNDVNDNPPTFIYKNYATGVSESDELRKILLTLFATDPDLDDKVTYFLLYDTIKVTGNNLDDVKETPFIVNEDTGVLQLNFKPKASMKGFFEFQVEARDLVNHTDNASVKIYLISDDNRLTFTFYNNANEIINNVNHQQLTGIFSAFFGGECNIDDILPKEINGVAQVNLADVRVHFIRNNEAVEATEILQKSSDIVFISELAAALLKISLNLQGVPEELAAKSQTDNTNGILQIVLISLSSILAAMLIATIIFHFLRTKRYERLVKALTDTNFGSNSTDLNRQIKILPNTNNFSTEKSNPVMNNHNASKVSLDTDSIMSSDSDDFADLISNPIFNISQHVDQPKGSNNNRPTQKDDSSFI